MHACRSDVYIHVHTCAYALACWSNVHIYVHTCAYTHAIHVRTCAYTHACHTHTHTHTHTQTHTYIHTHTFICTLSRHVSAACMYGEDQEQQLMRPTTYAHAHTHIHTCIYVYALTNMFLQRVCMGKIRNSSVCIQPRQLIDVYVCMCVRVCVCSLIVKRQLIDV